MKKAQFNRITKRLTELRVPPMAIEHPQMAPFFSGKAILIVVERKKDCLDVIGVCKQNPHYKDLHNILAKLSRKR